jgi:hypothetical protein
MVTGSVQQCGAQMMCMWSPVFMFLLQEITILLVPCST